nr:MAG TPA: hypothetical protein [Bacteriophage sp.]
MAAYCESSIACCISLSVYFMITFFLAKIL